MGKKKRAPVGGGAEPAQNSPSPGPSNASPKAPSHPTQPPPTSLSPQAAQSQNQGTAGSNPTGGERTIIATSPTLPSPTPAPDIPPEQSLTLTNARRPNRGVSGTNVKLITNHFVLKIKSPLIHHYKVEYPPHANNDISRSFKDGFTEKLLRRLIEEFQQTLQQIIHDGCRNIYSSFPLPLEGDAKEFTITLPESADPNEVHRVRITKTSLVVNNKALTRFVRSQISRTNKVDTAMNAVNIAMATLLEKNPDLVRERKWHINFGQSRELGQGLATCAGYLKSTRPAPGRILLNVDLSDRLLYQQGELLTLCLKFLGKEDLGPSAMANLQPSDLAELNRFFGGCLVRLTHRRSNNMRRIRKFVRQSAREITWINTSGEVQNIAQYFTIAYGRNLQFQHLPLIDVSSGPLSPPIYAPLEVCVVPNGVIMERGLPWACIKNVPSHPMRRPEQRLREIQEAHQVINHHDSLTYEPYGIEVGKELLRLQGRVLPPPKLVYGSPKMEVPTTEEIEQHQLYCPGKIRGWMVLVLENQNSTATQLVDRIKEDLSRAATSVGMQGLDVTPLVEWANPQGNIVKTLEDMYIRFRRHHSHPPSLIVVITSDRGVIYNSIKYFGDMKAGVATQCISSKLAMKANNSWYLMRLIWKINAKLGGIKLIPSTESVPLLGDPDQPVMIMGASVSERGLRSEAGRPLFTSVVGSVDTHGTKYVATIKPQKNKDLGQNLIDGIREATGRLVHSHAQYKVGVEHIKQDLAYPKRVILYRQGVSEGEYKKTIKREIEELKMAFKDRHIDPQLTYIVVGRRNHVRFFPEYPNDPEASDQKGGNVKAGLVVDTDIGHPFEFDWYAVYHEVPTGTSRPVHFTVAHDENNLSADALQQLTYALCHLNARSPRSISIPTPLFYANLVRERAYTHYDPRDVFKYFAPRQANPEEEDGNIFMEYHEKFMDVHPATSQSMYFI
ncbi:hypothetical protein FRC03_001193 [Tulasnella sp. 419]|nr:hypothetical protein FRC03_001193 [Tulasnella sp. 419]